MVTCEMPAHLLLFTVSAVVLVLVKSVQTQDLIFPEDSEELDRPFQRPNQRPQRPNQIPAQRPNQRPFQMPNQIPDQRPNQIPSGRPNQKPSRKPIQSPQRPLSQASTTRIPPRDPTNRIVYTVKCPCPYTREYSPVCGTDGQTYGNMAVFRCTQFCGSDVQLYLDGACGRNNG